MIIMNLFHEEEDYMTKLFGESSFLQEEHFEYQISKYLANKTELNKIDISSFLLNIKEFPYLYEEMVNVLMEGFTDYKKENLITINGYNINTIMEKEHVKLYEAYVYMMNLAKGFEYDLITTII